jgi:general secretion pathway protein H
MWWRGTTTQRSDAIHGFTLLEVLIALAILSLAAVGVGLAAPGLGARAALHRTAGEVDRLLMRARSEAIGGRGAVTVRFEAERRRLGIPALDLWRTVPAGIAVSLTGIADPLSRQGAWGGLDGVGLGGEASAIVFLADGSSTGGRLTLDNGRETIVRRISWTTGRVDDGP